jgi:hypothetical protein
MIAMSVSADVTRSPSSEVMRDDSWFWGRAKCHFIVTILILTPYWFNTVNSTMLGVPSLVESHVKIALNK